MAIMAFGMLAVVGVQSTLRANADIAKQRTEAARLAEQEIEAIRGFRTVGTATADDTEFDGIASKAPEDITPLDSNTTYQLTRTVTPAAAAGVRRPSITATVVVSWTDRHGQPQTVTLRDVIARTDPVLSGMLLTRKSTSAVGRKDKRHPTIPPRAHDLGDGTSIFKPNEGGTAAWIFNNATGVITHTCVVIVGSTSNSFTTAPATCTALSFGGQLLAGEIRFNLRGTPKDLGDGTSVMKPVSDDTVAWVVDHGTSKIIRKCNVSAGSTTASLAATDVAAGPDCTASELAISPFNAADSTHLLDATDSENPRWPVLPTTVDLALTDAPHSGSECFSSAKVISKDAVAVPPVQLAAEYFCIIVSDADKSWIGTSKLQPVAFAGSSVKWDAGTTATTYRVCRYTTATTDFTSNEDHPKNYSEWISGCTTIGTPLCQPVVGNLINQNFLVINGAKSCPTDVAATPTSGDLVNTNTLQHQP